MPLHNIHVSLTNSVGFPFTLWFYLSRYYTYFSISQLPCHIGRKPSPQFFPIIVIETDHCVYRRPHHNARFTQYLLLQDGTIHEGITHISVSLESNRGLLPYHEKYKNFHTLLFSKLWRIQKNVCGIFHFCVILCHLQFYIFPYMCTIITPCIFTCCLHFMVCPCSFIMYPI